MYCIFLYKFDRCVAMGRRFYFCYVYRLFSERARFRSADLRWSLLLDIQILFGALA
jgi:hypothetical protein